jgi:hypothetical protein
MKRTGVWMRTALALASAVACVIFLAAGLLLIGAQRAAGNQARVTEVLTNAFVRSGALTDLLAPELMKGLGNDRAFASLTTDEMREIVRTIFPPEWQEAQADQLAAQAYGYLFGGGSSGALMLSLEEPRRLMSGPAGVRVAQIMVRSWPACTADQIDALNRAPEILPEMFGCEPPEPAASRVVKALGAQLLGLAESAPGQIDLGGPVASSNVLREVHAILETLALWMVLSILLSGAALLFALALAARSLRSILRWTGVSWMSGAALAILAALILLALRSRLPAGASLAVPAVREAVAVLVRGLIGLALGAALVVSAVAFIVGSGVTAISFAVKSAAGLQAEGQMDRNRRAAMGGEADPRRMPSKMDIGGRETAPLPAPPAASDPGADGESPRGLFG